MDASQISIAHKRAPFSYAKYYNSQTLSDILIRYGNHGERTFFGHRLLLSTKARWFEAAFTGAFAEADATEITLKEDDPETVEAMFKFAYDQKIDLPDGNPPAENVVFAVGLFRTADKYSYSELEVEALDMVALWVNAVIDALAAKQHGDAALQSLLRVMNAVYEYEEESTTTRSLVKLRFLRAFFDHVDTSPLGPASQYSELVNAAAAKVPEFGRDLYLGLVERRDDMSCPTGRAYLGIEPAVRCPTCGETWQLPSAHGFEGYCWECGMPHEDWHLHVIHPTLRL